MNCILFAVYLPSTKKKFVLEEIFEHIRKFDKSSKIFIGIQHNSIPETEEILRKTSRNLNIECRRVPVHMMIDSDASSFITALELYADSDMDFELVFFVHSKGITSGNDPLRKQMYDLIFDKKVLGEKLSDPKVGSYSPYLTITDVKEDINKMGCMSIFNPKLCTQTVLEYYYINTFFVMKNHVLGDFIESVSPKFFNTNISEYSDRWMMERDFSHIADMQGYLPSASWFHGNYSTNFTIPTTHKYHEKLDKWNKENENERN